MNNMASNALEQLEAPLHPLQKKQVLEAIHQLNLKVSPAEVATAANLPVLVATQELNNIAAETGAHLEVSDRGNIMYCFAPTFEQAYGLKSSHGILSRVGRVLYNAILLSAKMIFLASFFVIRMSFGVLLVTSVLLIVFIIVAICVLLLLRVFALFSDSGSGDSGGFDFDLGALDLSGFDIPAFDSGPVYRDRPFWLYWSFDWIWDWIYFGDYLWTEPTYAYSSVALQGSPPDSTQKQKKKSKFLDHCYIMLFGTSNPNEKLDELRWAEISNVIRANSGVVTCEQVAPYIDVSDQNEDWMVPVLQRFNGLPEVSERGNIIYIFPAFQQQASLAANDAPNVAEEPATIDPAVLQALVMKYNRRQRTTVVNEIKKKTLQPYLKEEHWTMGLTAEEMLPVFTYAAVAFGGAYALNWYGHISPLVHHLRPILLPIMAYSSIFAVVPAIRYYYIAMLNERIDARNNKRSDRAALLVSPSLALQEKLDDARAVATASRSKDEHLAFTTERGSLEQQFAD